jgi:hypothetical protein
MVVVRASLLISIGFFVKAHYESYEEGKAKSNSLLYIYNADTDKRVGQLMMLIWILGPKNI